MIHLIYKLIIILQKDSFKNQWLKIFLIININKFENKYKILYNLNI